eukprot:jgi/Picsp_1/4178/NSC_01687-R1_zinc finger ccch domain-containing protein 51
MVEGDSVVKITKKRKNLRKRRAAESDEEVGEQEQATVGGASNAVQEAREKVARLQQGNKPLAFSNKKEQESRLFAFESSGMEARSDHVLNDATRNFEKVVEAEEDARRGKFPGQTDDGDDEKKGMKKYKGMSGYKDYRAGFRQEESKQGGFHGPKRPSGNVRMSVLVDYQPDICKDYKETGYCGFGDSCKFLHDRGDYKAGWQLDRDWEEEQKARQAREREGWVDDDEEEKSSDDDDLPFACFICRRLWNECQDPVVTRCGHYFCEQCALKQNAKSGKCFVCEKPTGGIFNVAKDIIKREKLKNIQ